MRRQSAAKPWHIPGFFAQDGREVLEGWLVKAWIIWYLQAAFTGTVALVIRTIICQSSSTELTPDKLVITKNHHFAGKIATLYLLRQHTA
jgi:hypothetical protein